MRSLLKTICYVYLLLLGCTSAASSSIKVHYQNDYHVIFLPGFSVQQRDWQPIIDELPATIQSSFHESILFDNNNQSLSIEQHIACLNKLITKIRLQQKVIIVGHSLGGLLATEYVKKYPQNIDALILLDPSVMQQRVWFKQFDEKRIKQDDEKLRSFLPHRLKTVYNHLISELDAADRQVTPLPPSTKVTLFTSMKVPTNPLFFEETQQGKQLWLKLHTALLENVEQQSHILLSDVGHNIHLERPELLQRKITETIDYQHGINEPSSE
ncbi:alpha/beta fold hydrolase (plasmid) [Pseudoalteromonas sp. T1lg65]|uniref:alpha/beta fold hydrolase n=1 Tax=Pseudoalteromonas sp. T1lg65 TaxID=2077101 RepID=UPI003F7A3BCA